MSWGPGRVDVFVRGTDNNLWHKWYSGGWFGWENLGGPIYSAPTVASWGSGRLDVFAIGPVGSVKHKWFGGGWSGWEDLGGTSWAHELCCWSAPAAVSWGPGRIDLFVRGTEDSGSNLWHKWFNGGWSGWENVDVTSFYSAPTVASWGSGRLDVFVSGTYGDVLHKWYSGGWSAWEDLGGTAHDDGETYSSPAAVSWGSGRVDVFVLGTDANIWHKWWE